MTASSTWREEDERLLRGLLDERILEHAWGALARGCVRQPHRRAAGLFQAMREAGYESELLQAEHGQLEPLLDCLWRMKTSGLEDRLVHHLALLFEAAGHALLAEGQGERSAAAFVRSISAWLRLAERPDYLRTLASQVAGDKLSPDELAQVAAQAPFGLLERLGEIALEHATERTESSAQLLGVLAHFEEDIGRDEYSENLVARATALARAARSAAVDEAIEEVERKLDDAVAREASTSLISEVLREGVDVWLWSGRDVSIEQVLARRLNEISWPLYHARRMEEIRHLLGATDEPTRSLTERILRDPVANVAYASHAAQAAVFRAECATTFDDQLQASELAVKLCPTHRNGRHLLAALLVERAMHTLDGALPWNTGDALSAAAADVLRAQKTFPNLSRIENAKQRLKAMGRDIDE